MPWLAAIFAAWCDGYPYSIPFKQLFFDSRADILIWMLLPAGITFLALLPFLRYRLCRKALAFGLCVMWFMLMQPGKTKGYESSNQSWQPMPGNRLVCFLSPCAQPGCTLCSAA
jgi:hypothetical protein